MATEGQPFARRNGAELSQREGSDSHSILRRSWHAMTDLFAPFSSPALASLPKNPEGLRQRSTRADRIPDTEADEGGQRPTVRDYHSINVIPPRVRVPKKIATPIRVEGKVGSADRHDFTRLNPNFFSQVWFANERSAHVLVQCDSRPC
jgi:hypothetical protein